jgi:Apea-like HEPN
LINDHYGSTIAQVHSNDTSRGLDEMTHMLDTEAKEPQIENWYVLIAGLPRPNDPLEITPGLSLRPLDSPLSVFDLAAAGAVGFREWAILEPFTRICTCEIETATLQAALPGYDALNRAWLVSALLVLRGFSRHLAVACSAYSWNLVAGHQKRTSSEFRHKIEEGGVIDHSKRDLPQFHGNVLDYHLKIFAEKAARTDSITDEDAVWIRNHFDVCNRLAHESNAFRLALEAAVDWRYAKEPRSAVARLWGGIEAIFGISSELVYRISLLTASLLEPRGEARKARFAAVKRLYGLRSKVVHGEDLTQEKINSAMNDSYHLLRDLLLLTIAKGHVLRENDFDEAVFG